MNGISHVVETEVLPGVVVLVDETCWHPSNSGGVNNSGPNRPCRPCSDDYVGKDTARLRPLDQYHPLHYRLAAGFRMMGGGS